MPVPLESFLGPLAPAHFSEFVVGVLLAVLLAVGIQKMVVPKFEAMYAQRSAQIEGGINRAQQIQAEAEAAKRNYEEQLANSRSDAAKLRDEARADAKRIIDDAKAKAQLEYDRMLEQAKAQIEVERLQAFTDLKQDVGVLAVQLSERILEESLAEDERANRTVDRFLAELAAQPTQQAPDYLPGGN